MTVVMTGNVRELQVLGGRLHNNNLELYRLFMDTKFEVVSSDID